MSSVNVLPPSAPEYSHTIPLYPALPEASAQDFRLKKISDLQKELENEADHYRLVAKKYKRTHSIVHGTAVGLGLLAAGLSSAGVATALTGVGIVVTPALGGIAALTGFSTAVGLTAVSKRLERKITKHEKIYTLAVAKQNSVSELVSKALADNTISEGEFSIILREVESYHKLKADIRSGAGRTQPQSVQTQAPDVEKIRKEIRAEEQEKLQKKNTIKRDSLQRRA